MTRFFYSIYLNLKLILKSIPKLIITSLILLLLIGGISYTAINKVYENNDFSITNVAVYVPGDSIYNSVGISFIKNMESFSSICTLTRVANIDEGYAMLDNKEAVAYIIIPEAFIDDIENGKDTPATLFFANTNSIEEHLLKELFQSGCSVLLDAQSGIYTVYDIYVAQNAPSDQIKSSNKEINKIYIDYVLLREKVFNKVNVSATDTLSLFENYVSMAFTVILLLLGIALCNYLIKPNKGLQDKYKIYEFNNFAQMGSQIISLFFVYYLTYIALCWALIFITRKYLSTVVYVYPSVILLIATIISGISMLTTNDISNISTIFIFTIISTFVSGGFIPIGFLPKIFKALRYFMPTTYIINQIGYGLCDNTNMYSTLIPLLLSGIIYLAVSSIFTQKCKH